MVGIILFDGVCNLCNGAVNFVIDHDPYHRFKFAALQSDAGQQILLEQGLKTTDFDTIVLFKNGKIYQKSDAALEIARYLTGFWRVLYVFIIFPRFLRDMVYDAIARNRYRLFGKSESCRLPTADLLERFKL